MNLPYDVELIDDLTGDVIAISDSSSYDFEASLDTLTYKNRFSLSVLSRELAINSIEHGKACAPGKVTLKAASNQPQISGLQYRWYQDLDSQVPMAETSNGEFITPEIDSTQSYFVVVSHPDGCESERVKVVAEIEELAKPEITKQGLNELISSYATGNQWFYNGQPILNANSNTITINKPGIYGVQVDKNTCKVYQEKEIHAADLSPNGKSMVVYPSPADNLLNLSFPEYENQHVDVIIYNTLGRLVMTKSLDISLRKGQIDISSLQNGVFFLEVYTDRDKYTTRFIKRF